MEMFTFIAIVSVVLFVFGYVTLRDNRNPGAKRAPCLPRLPILGSIPFMRGKGYIHLRLLEKAKIYGNIFGFYSGSRYTIVLHGHDAIREAFVTRSVDFAGRGSLYFEKNISPDGGRGVIFRQFGEEHKSNRRNSIAILKDFGFGNRMIMERKIQIEVEELLKQIRAKNGSAWYPASVLESAILNVIYNLVLNERFELGDPVAEHVKKSCRQIIGASDPICNILPIINYLPKYRKKYALILEQYNILMGSIKQKIDECIARKAEGDTFVEKYIEMTSSSDYDKHELAIILRDLIIAGTETTSGQLGWSLVLLGNNPKVLARVQKEIDEVVPTHRLPSLHDKPKLPYLEATILEVMRLRTALPMGLPHTATCDTEISGYEVPAGSLVMANLWSAHMDPDVWQEPEKFCPERFLDKNGNVINRDLMISFSFGKRSCLGEVLARQEMFLFLSGIIQQFNILPPEGQTKISDGMVHVLVLSVEPHELRLTARA